jgi:hypothetical protein
MMPPEGYTTDLETLARKVVQGLDQRGQHVPRQPGSRIATQINGSVISNNRRVLNVKSKGINVLDEPDNHRSTLVIPTGYLVCVVDGGGVAIVPSLGKPQATIAVNDNVQVTKWTITADVTGTIVFDIKKSSYASWPSTSSIIVSASPTLTSQQKNQGVVTNWTQLLDGDMLDIFVTAATAVTRVTLTLQVQGVS